MKHNFFQFASVTFFERISIAVHVVASAILLILIWLTGHSNSTGIFFFKVYALMAQLFLFYYNYRSMRNLTVYLSWLSLTLSQLILCAFMGSHAKDIYNPWHDVASSLKSIFVLLLVYQLIRWISVKLQHMEFVVGIRGSEKDILGERRVSFLDNILVILWFSTIIAWNLVILPNV